MPSLPCRWLATSVLCACSLVGQCANAWVANLSLPSPATIYSTTMWDPDGAGPQPQQLVVGGAFGPTGTTPFNGIATWNAASGAWQPVGSFSGWQVTVMESGFGGELYAAELVSLPSVTFRVSAWDGIAWTQLGGLFNQQVIAAVVLANGDLVVAGGFSQVGTTSAAGIARWDGTSWQAIGGGLSSYCDELLVMPNGDLVAGGFFGIARWDGATWTQLGTSPGWALSLAVLPTGDLVAGLDYNTVVRWDGASWTPLGGSVVANWQANIEALVALPNGDLIAGEGNLNQGSTSPLARWDGVAWTPITSGGTAYGAVRKLVLRPGSNMDVLAVGNFMSLGGLAVNSVARLTTTCPASVATIANGCAGGGITLTTEPAWAGATWKATASGVPQSAFVVGAYGLTATTTPLGTLLPQSLSGCTLHLQPDVLELLPVSSGVASATWTLPNQAALAGSRFRHQMIVLQTGPGSGIANVVASDAVELTVGVF